ncbi:MAG: hypothetical protein IPK81_09525 [Rhodospirillales bacterium]|nr:MAG: hypothetical protein IPK81_09525 [Rhodospirillales bacterium]
MIRSASPHSSSVGAAISGRRLASRVSPSGQKMRRRGLAGPGHLDRPFDRIGAGRHLDQLRPVRRLGAHQAGQILDALRPGVGRGILLVVEPERRDQRHAADRLGEHRGHLGRQRAAGRAADQIGAAQPGGVEQMADREDPVEMRVEGGMAGGAGEAR